MITDKNNAFHGKTRLLSNRQQFAVRGASPLTILDGDGSLIRINEIDSKLIVCLVDCSEYSEDIEQIIMQYAGYAENKYLSEIPKNIINLPSGFDAAIFGLPDVIGI
jgi:hypothetical protein